MGLLKFTKSYSSSDDGSDLSGSDLQQLQTDISNVLNAGISNANIASDAAIVESKLSFSTSSGHTHDGSTSAYPLIKHYRKGMRLTAGTLTTDITVLPGVIDIDGALLRTVASTADIAIGTAGNWLAGQAITTGINYVYAYNNAGTIGFKLSTEVPELSDADGSVVETPFRYHLKTAVYYRLIGSFYYTGAAIAPGTIHSFDASNFVSGYFDSSATTGDIVLATGWTPKWVKVMVSSDASPGDGEAISTYEASYYLESTDSMNVYHVSATYAYEATEAITAITPQTVAAIGSFTLENDVIYAAATARQIMYLAWTDEV